MLYFVWLKQEILPTIKFYIIIEQKSHNNTYTFLYFQDVTLVTDACYETAP